ncbi:MAG: MBL fold metallo-hydrolase [Planctomycetota bacterium]|jgi:3',5'-cyclic-nucleotide phosphodiesterase
MNLRVLGCHGGTSKRHRNVSFLVDERVALDAGSVSSGLDLEEQARLERVLVTHAHMDHIGELPTLLDARLQQDAPTLEVIGLAETLEALKTHIFNDVVWPDFARLHGPRGPALAYRTIEPEQVQPLGGLSAQAVLVDHSVPSAGFLLADGERTLAYSGDTGPTERFWELVQATGNLCALITEVSFPDEREELARVSGHLTPHLLREQLERVPRQRDVPLLIYGLKPVHEERIVRELEALGLENLHVLSAGESFGF